MLTVARAPRSAFLVLAAGFAGEWDKKSSKSAQCLVFNASYNFMPGFRSWRLAIVDSASIHPIILG